MEDSEICLTKGLTGSDSARVCKGRGLLSSSSDKLVNKKKRLFHTMQEPRGSRESCFWFGETGLDSLQPTSIILQVKVISVNIRPFGFRSCVLGAWGASANKAKILVLVELTF